MSDTYTTYWRHIHAEDIFKYSFTKKRFQLLILIIIEMRSSEYNASVLVQVKGMHFWHYNNLNHNEQSLTLEIPFDKM